jgi:hypothetical protein
MVSAIAVPATSSAGNVAASQRDLSLCQTTAAIATSPAAIEREAGDERTAEHEIELATKRWDGARRRQGDPRSRWCDMCERSQRSAHLERAGFDRVGQGEGGAAA